MSARFYCPDLPQSGNLRLGADESRHLSRVCRLGVGDIVELFDVKGHAIQAHVVKVESISVELIGVWPPLPDRPAPLSLTLATAVPKGERFDWLVEKATELGIERLIPIVTERSVALPGAPKLERLGEAIIAASKQCRAQLRPADSGLAHAAGTRSPVSIPTRCGSWRTRMEFRRRSGQRSRRDSPLSSPSAPKVDSPPARSQAADQTGWVAVSLWLRRRCASKRPVWPAARPCSHM